jgi:5'(3')-deoxyribonucleotidase
MDDVCADFQSSYVKLLNKTFGKPPVGTAPIDWEGSNLELTHEEMLQSWKEVAKVYNFWYELDPLPNFDAETIKLLKIAHWAHDVFFVTNRFDTPGPSPLRQTKAWLQRYAGIGSPNVIIAKDKGPVAQVLQLDAFIDDRPKNCLDVFVARPETEVYLCDSSHNKTFEHEIIPRVQDLKEFLQTLGVN